MVNTGQMVSKPETPALRYDQRPDDNTPVNTVDLPATPTRDRNILATAWIQAPSQLLELGDGLSGQPGATFKRRIGEWLLWRAGPASGADACYWAGNAQDLGRQHTFRLFADGSGQGSGPSGVHHRWFRTWKEDLLGRIPSSTVTEPDKAGSMVHLTTTELEAGLAHVRESPQNRGRVELIVRRPALGEREVLEQVELNMAEGVAGDTWNVRGSKRTDDGSSHPDMQLNLINARVAALIAIDPDRRALAGDQLHLDLDLSAANLPAGTQLSLGSAVIEITAQPHLGCAKFTQRFGLDAHRWVNSALGRELNLRGVNARVVTPGIVSHGDTAVKL